MIIWIASYPKSGNTWVRAFLTSYYFTNDGIFDPKNLKQIPDYPNKQIIGKQTLPENTIHLYWKDSQEKFIRDNKVRFLKTHNALLSIGDHHFTTSKTTIGVIYVIRDPRNVITSIKNHMDLDNYDEAFTYMTDRNKVGHRTKNNNVSSQFISSWRINYISWFKSKFRKLIIRYEDMLNKPDETFKKIVLFVNTLSNHEKIVDEAKLKKAIATTNFENMKKSEEKGDFKESLFSEKKKEKIKFFFLGPKNNWKEKLDSDLINKMNSYYKADLFDLGYKN